MTRQYKKRWRPALIHLRDISSFGTPSGYCGASRHHKLSNNIADVTCYLCKYLIRSWPTHI